MGHELEQAVNGYQKLLELSADMVALAEKGDETALEELMKQRDTLIDELKEQEPQVRVEAEDVADDDPYLEKLAFLIREIMELDDRTVKLLEANKLDIKTELKQVTRGNKAAHGYLKQDEGQDPRIINIKK